MRQQMRDEGRAGRKAAEAGMRLPEGTRGGNGRDEGAGEGLKQG